ncbi:MAG TPA: hypothetical protein VFW59_10700 [Gallionella sp.]|nr:hypothetical protein [Gallionella sp.]
MDNGNTGCKRFLLSGAGAVVLTILAFVSGANALGMVLVGVAIASFGYGAGTVMNSPEPMHKLNKD